jgi:Ca2+-binding RTX toxin-like protein
MWSKSFPVWATVSYTDKKGNLEEVKSKIVDVTISTKPSAFHDLLTGTDGANKLNGLAGNDTLIAGLGADTLTGWVGADVFKFTAINDSTPKNHDFITDFKHVQGDKLDFSAIDASFVLTGNTAFTYIGTGVFSAEATGQLRFDAKTFTLYGSTNADSNAEFSVVLIGVKSLDVDDFIL